MTGVADHQRPLGTRSDFFVRAQERLTFEVPGALTNPDAVGGSHARIADPDALAAIAAIRPIRPSAVLVPVIQRDEPSILLTERNAGLNDHGGEISFAGGKIDAADANPTAAALREAEEEIGLARKFVEPLGYLDLHVTPFGHRILPVVARILPGFVLTLNRDEVETAFELPLAVLMATENHKPEAVTWNGFSLESYVMQIGDHRIWGATALILRNLYERIYRR